MNIDETPTAPDAALVASVEAHETKAAAAAILSAVASEALHALSVAVQVDAENRYSLLEAWPLPGARCPFFRADSAPYNGPRIVIEKAAPSIPNGGKAGWETLVTITVKPYQSTKEENICDGASFFPDGPRGILPAALFHDPWYLEIDAIAAHFGVSRRAVRKFGDEVFASIVLAAGGRPWLAGLVYRGVRYGYPLYRLAKPFLRLAGVGVGCVTAAILAGGAAGGCAPHSVFANPDAWRPPVYEQTAPQTPSLDLAREFITNAYDRGAAQFSPPLATNLWEGRE